MIEPTGTSASEKTKEIIDTTNSSKPSKKRRFRAVFQTQSPPTQSKKSRKITKKPESPDSSTAAPLVNQPSWTTPPSNLFPSNNKVTDSMVSQEILNQLMKAFASLTLKSAGTSEQQNASFKITD